MDYEVGSIADFISGNITPNRPKCIKGPVTPTKHKLSPSITPKSAGLVDKSQFLSPSVQKKKDGVKKSPKRIFQADNMKQKADTKAKLQLVKKHLEDELESNSGKNVKRSKKKRKNCEHYHRGIDNQNESAIEMQHKKLKKIKPDQCEELTSTPKNKKSGSSATTIEKFSLKKKKNRENKNGSLKENKNKELTKNAKDEQTESEHSSDDAIYSENESEIMQFEEEKDINNSESSAEDEKEVQVLAKHENNFNDMDEIKRTLYVGNVPFTKKTKKVIRSIFNKYGKIITIRIRNVPIKDSRLTPKLAIIKNEIHPDNPVVSCFVKFACASSIEKALEQNNALIGNHHIRVDRSDSIGHPNDPRKTLFVGNIPLGIQDETLRSIFEKCGEIDSVRIVRDRVTQIGKGIGFVNFSSVDGVELALMLEEKDIIIKNRILRLRRYNQNPKPQAKHLEKGNSASNKEGAFKRIKNKQAKENNQQSHIRGIQQQKKEYIGTTAGKVQKKKKPNKGLKKQKKLSKILTAGST